MLILLMFSYICSAMDTTADYKVLFENATQRIAFLEHELGNLKRLVYGSKHERFVPNTNPSQLPLALPDVVIPELPEVPTKKIEYERKVKNTKPEPPKHPGRYKIPEHIERRIIQLQPTTSVEGCRIMGEEVTEELDYEPGKLFVNRYVRTKYAKPNNEGVIIAPMVNRPLDKSIAGPGLLTQIIIDKYVDHLPLHRQQQRFKREGINIPYNTITEWVSSTCKLIEPLYQALLKEIMRNNYLHVDETPFKVLDKDKKGETHRGYLWVYHNSINGLVYFDYREGRGREGPVEMLQDFKGYLQTDGYVVYDMFKKQEDITVLHCMAHARRMFFEAQDNDKATAQYALEQIGKLYAIERKAKEEELTADEIYTLRQEESLPILTSMKQWMTEAYIKALPKSAIGKALGYSLQRWKELVTYTTDGNLNIDNNPVENSIRPVALGRKNYLFAGSHEAAKRSAMLYSLMGTCKMHGINPFIYLKDVLQRIGSHPINQIELLLPQNWKAGG